MKIIGSSATKLKYTAITLGCLLLANLGFGQNHDVHILGSTTVFITGGTTVSFTGTNWISSSNVQGTGPVIFNRASGTQNIDMNNLSISGITVNNAAHVNMLDSMTVANTTLFTSGNLKMDNYRITQSGKVEGQGSTGRFEANGNSIMVFDGAGGNDSFFLEQATPNTTNRLKDLTLNRNGNTLVCGDTAQIRGIVYHLAGTIEANGSRLKLKGLSPSQFGQVSGIGTGTISGTMYMEMSVGSSVASSLNQWRHFTSPLTGAMLTTELNDDISLTYSPISNCNIWNFDQTRSVNSWRPIQADEDMHNNDYAIYLNGSLPASPNFIVDINGGYPGTGNFNRTLGRDNPNGYTGQGFDDTVGWHMIANPYPSSLSFQYQSDLEGGSAYYVWDITGIWDDSTGCGGCKKRGIYSLYRADNGLTSNGGRSTVPPFHVFYVRAAVNNTAFGLGNSWRTTDSMHNYIGRKTDVISDKLHIKVKSPEKNSDEIYLWFDKDRASNGYDKLDAFKLWNDPFAPNIFTLTDDGKKTAHNVLKEIPKDKNVYSVEMPFSCKLAGEFEMSLDFENADQVKSIVLEDRKTKTFTNVLNTTMYKFMNTENDVVNRFVIHFGKEATGIEDEIAQSMPIQIGSDATNIFVRFPIMNETTATVSVYDMLGRMVMDTQTADTQSDVFTINGAGLSAGYYTVKVQTGTKVVAAPVFIGNN